MWAPVCKLWWTLDTCQNPGPRRCGVTSSRMLVEGGLIVRSSTVTDRSIWGMLSLPRLATGSQIRLEHVEPADEAIDRVDDLPIVHEHVVDLHRAHPRAARRRRHVVRNLLR